MKKSELRRLATQSEYAQIANRLCHIIPLSKEGKVNETVDELIVTAIVFNNVLKLATTADVVNCVEANFKLTLHETTAQGSLDRLQSARRVIKDKSSGRFSVPDAVIETKTLKAQQFAALEEQIKQEWLDSLEIEISSEEKGLLWNCLQAYMKKAFYRHGIETLTLLTNTETNDYNSKARNVYLNEAIEEHCRELAESAKNVVPKFFENSPENRVIYVSHQVDATFALFALTSDQATTEYLRKSLSQLLIFLDTNFIFALLGLADSRLGDVAQELFEFIQKHQLPFQLVYHAETLRELKAKINIAKNKITNRPTQELSRTIIQRHIFDGIFLRYHQANAEKAISPDVYFAKFADMPALLEHMGFRPYNDAMSYQQTVTLRGEIVARYKSFLENHRRDKNYHALNHDVEVWLAVQRTKRKGVSLLDSGAIFLTIDFFLQRFERQELRDDIKQSNSGMAVVLPDQLLQLLRPFVPPTEQSNKNFIEIFSVLEIRAFESDFSHVQEESASLMNHMGGLPEKTQMQILKSEYFGRALTQLEKQDAAVDEIVNSTLVQINQEVTADRAKAHQQIAESKKQINAKDHELEVTQQTLAAVKTELETTKELAQKTQDEVAQSSVQNADLKSQLEQLLTREKTRPELLRVQLKADAEQDAKIKIKKVELYHCNGMGRFDALGLPPLDG